MKETAGRMSGAEYMAAMFKGYGTTHLFFMEAILRDTIKEAERLGIKGIMSHSEIGAGYMADGYARMTNRPGICLSQSIGAANLAAGLGDAWLANSPVIAITGKKPPFYQYKNAYQEVDHAKVFDGITKFNCELAEIGQLPFLLRQLYREVTTAKARPAHMDLPGLTGKNMETAALGAPVFVQERFARYPAFRGAAEAAAVEEAALALAAAKRPLLAAGRGAAVSGAGEALCALARKCDIPVATTPDGKCLIDETDPLWAGIVGFYGMRCANKAAASADLIIFVGTQTSDQTTNDWRTPPPDKKVIQIDIDGAELGKNYPATIGLCGDAAAVLRQLGAAAAESKRPQWRAAVGGWRRETLAHYAALAAVESVPMMPERLLCELGRVLPADAVLVSDTGYSAQWTSILLRMKPTQKYIRAAGSLGWAFPAALGVKCGAGERPVICFIGDAGFYYYMNEMETAVRYGINTVTVLNNNRVQAQSIPNLKAAYPEDPAYAVRRTAYPETDFSKIAAEMGLFALRVTEPKAVAPAIEQALLSSRPALVEVITYGDHAVPDPLAF